MNFGNDQSPNNSRVLAGVFIICIGFVFLLRQMGISIFPYWIFSWPMILIAVGVYVGIKNNFRGAGWLVLLIIGTFFLFDKVLDMYELRRYLVPAILIAVGAMLILRPKKDKPWKLNRDKWRSNFYGDNSSEQTQQQTAAADTAVTNGSDEERLNASAIFGSVEKIIVSKNFKGGEAVSIFGGSEIDLSKADINGTVSVDVTAIFGGIKLVVPSHWTLKQEVAAIFGGVEDKRDMHSILPAGNKVLVLKGTAFMGGIEITSYR